MPHSQYKGLLEEINQEYHILFNEISQKVQQLNKYAVQGDINASNVSLKDGELYIFDFNIACDEYLIIQAVLEGLCLSYEEKYSDHSTVEERFIAFISGYQKERQPNQTEKELIPLIYKVANTLWFTKIQYHNDSIESLLQQSNDQAVKNILHFMLQSLKK
jgi:Ser/Thr protein kinase RdoA (MazF antagonist)